MEASGIGLPVIEAHCEYKSPARYDDELVVKTRGSCCRRRASSSRTKSAGRATRPSTPSAAPFMRPSTPTGARAGCPTTFGSCWNEGAGHRRRRLHRIASVCRAARAGATVTGIDCFTDYYPRPLKEANLATVKGRPGFTFRRGGAAGHRPQGRCSPASPTCSTWRPGRGPEELGTRFRRLYKEQRRGDSAPARGAGRDADPEIRIRLELVGLRRPRAAADARRRVFAAACPPTASRSWPPSIWGISTGPTMACPRCRCGISRCMARDSGRIWGFSGF